MTPNRRLIDRNNSPDSNRSQHRTILFTYIETFYNRNRHQARLGHRTPAAVYADHAA